jgi:mevalonate pyrophosphate decarboxylase
MVHRFTHGRRMTAAEITALIIAGLAACLSGVAALAMALLLKRLDHLEETVDRIARALSDPSGGWSRIAKLETRVDSLEEEKHTHTPMPFAYRGD